MTGLPGRLQQRIERSCEARGVHYPWWIPAYSTLACVALDVAAYVQRGALHPQATTLAAALIALIPLVVWAARGVLLPPWLEASATTVAVVLFLVHPVTPDFAPMLCMIAAGEVAATSRVWIGLTVATVDGGVLLAAAGAGHLDNAALYVIGVVLGADVGIALRWQMRALHAERENSVMAGERAMLAERQRIAREVHDVVGHALSINLLHVTAARHALQEHADVGDAIESLTEAEQVGRGAMGDLRRTVAVLGAGPGETQPLPGVDDLPTLIEQARAAGLDVRADQRCDSGLVGAAAGLGLYRIVQESLANIAKHAPGSAAHVDLAAGDGGVRLIVRNTLPDGPPAASTGGSGLPGMAARAEQLGADLRAGVDGSDWVVRLILPVTAPTPGAAVSS